MKEGDSSEVICEPLTAEQELSVINIEPKYNQIVPKKYRLAKGKILLYIIKENKKETSSDAEKI